MPIRERQPSPYLNAPWKHAKKICEPPLRAAAVFRRSITSLIENEKCKNTPSGIVLRCLAEMADGVRQTRNALDEALFPPKQTTSGHLTRIAARVVLAIGMVIGSGTAVFHGTKPGEQSEATSDLVADSNVLRKLPDRNAPIAEIKASLNSIKRMHAFAKKEIEHIDVDFPLAFLETFSMTMEELQAAGWKCPCNGFVNFYGETLHAHNVASRRISIRPNWLRWTHHAWHQFLIIEHEDSITVLNGREDPVTSPSLDTYMAEHYKNMTVVLNAEWLETGPSVVSRLMAEVHGSRVAGTKVTLPTPPITVASSH